MKQIVLHPTILVANPYGIQIMELEETATLLQMVQRDEAAFEQTYKLHFKCLQFPIYFEDEIEARKTTKFFL